MLAGFNDQVERLENVTPACYDENTNNWRYFSIGVREEIDNLPKYIHKRSVNEMSI